MNELIGTTYHICKSDIEGNEVFRLTLDGSEFITTTCPVCETEFWLDIYDFFELVGNCFCLHSSHTFCRACSATKHIAQHDMKGDS